MTPEQKAATQAAFLSAVTNGDTLKQACKAANVAWGSVSRWIEADPEFAARYARARTVSADFYADKAQDAVEQAVSPQDAALARVKADVYKWRAAMASPAYRDRQVSENTGTVTIKVVRDAGIAATARIESAYGAERALPAAYDTEAVEADPG